MKLNDHQPSLTDQALNPVHDGVTPSVTHELSGDPAAHSERNVGPNGFG
jgi:hypothetical protein